MTEEWARFDAVGGAIRGFLVQPSSPPPWPALIVLHPIAGVMAQMQDIVRGFAADGYLTLAPDLYTNDPGYQKIDVANIIAAHGSPNEPDWEERMMRIPEPRRTGVRAAREWMTNRPKAHYADGVRGAFDYLEHRADVTKIGAIGYCMGGQYVGQLATQGVVLAAGVIFYGASPALADVGRIRGPLEGHYGVTDRKITAGVYDFALAMKAAGKYFAYTVYDADHGFNDAPPARGYNPYAARMAHERTRAFLAEHLQHKLQEV
jgi:carboxymethylenebutenolidase